MATTKTATLTIRVDPGLKDALRAAAQAEHRSIANMVEVLIREHCEKSGIAIGQPGKIEQLGEHEA
ncbi:ribbon-helix-helix protein, CopG family [Aeromonas veronii]